MKAKTAVVGLALVAMLAGGCSTPGGGGGAPVGTLDPAMVRAAALIGYMVYCSDHDCAGVDVALDVIWPLAQAALGGVIPQTYREAVLEGVQAAKAAMATVGRSDRVRAVAAPLWPSEALSSTADLTWFDADPTIQARTGFNLTTEGPAIWSTAAGRISTDGQRVVQQRLELQNGKLVQTDSRWVARFPIVAGPMLATDGSMAVESNDKYDGRWVVRRWRGGAFVRPADSVGAGYAFVGDFSGDFFGSACALTDVDGDGLTDVVVGAPYGRKTRVEQADADGAVYVWLGKTRGTGDANGDGAVNNIDALMVAAFFLDPAAAPTISGWKADVNRDGALTNLDALAIQQYFLGKVPKLPIR